jgi:peptidoglycan/LPS O-acetylase OafA/YrhL
MQYKLESLRGLAACLVVLFHSPFSHGSVTFSFVSNSYLFVDLFFILSGFVMCLAYSSRINKGLRFKEYIFLRLGRIYPLHLLLLFTWIPYVFLKEYLYVSGVGGSSPTETNNFWSFVSNLLLINSMGIHNYLSWNTPAWSISTEFFTYVTFFWVTVILDRRQSLLLPLSISVFSYGFLISLGKDSLDITYDYGFFRCLAAFYLGVFVHRFRRVFLSNFNRLSGNILSICEILCFLSIIIFVSLASTHLLYFIPVILSFSLSIFVFSQDSSGFLGRVLLREVIKNIGKWSFSIYMIHVLVILILSNSVEYLFKLNINSPLGIYAFLINLGLLVLIIFISKYTYIFIEAPFRNKTRALVRG